MTWARRHKIRTALLAALAAGLAIGITVSMLSGSHPVGRTTAAPPVVAFTRGARWLSGPAGALLRAVNADLGRLSTAERSAQPAGVPTAGTQLGTDSRAALDGPMPPVDVKIYRSALQDFSRSGRYAVRGMLGKASALMNAGDSDITKVTSAVNSPATVSEPNGH
jgi:hypothetical protein